MKNKITDKEPSGYKDDTLQGKPRPQGSTEKQKGADTDKNYGSGINTSPASEWDEGGTRSRRGAPRVNEGRKKPDAAYGDADERARDK